MEQFPNGAGYRPEVEDVYPVEDNEVHELESEDDILAMLHGDDIIGDDDILD